MEPVVLFPCRVSALAAVLWLVVLLALGGCDGRSPNNPYPAEDDGRNLLYSSFTERPKHLDPARAYSSNEYEILGQVYEPLYQYHYLKRPYALIPQSAADLPQIRYLDSAGQELAADAVAENIAVSEYNITLKPDVRYQPHPAFSKASDGRFRYHALTEYDLDGIGAPRDFAEPGTRSLTAEDFAYAIKRLVHPQLHSPIAEMMKEHIVGLKELSDRVEADFRKA
ncbi:MAG: peptide ABC transporter substrate-binding protein, partial [Methylococcaceae bacterium]|nr:peptide ABC transporter substrate-binding protein [Methylococcaceae bacterium]